CLPLRRISFCHVDISSLRVFDPLGIIATKPQTLAISAAAELFSLIQDFANHSTPIGRASCRGLVQSIFSSPSWRSRFASYPRCFAPRRWTKNALHYVLLQAKARCTTTHFQK